MIRSLFLIAAVVLILFVFVFDVRLPSIILQLIGVGGAIFYLRCLATDNKFYILAITLLYLPMAKIAPFAVAKGVNLTNILVLSLFYRYYLTSPEGRLNGDRRMRNIVYLIFVFIIIGLVQGLIRAYSPSKAELFTYTVELVVPWLLYLGLTGCFSSLQDVRHALFFSWCGSTLSILNGFNEYREKRWASSIEKSRVNGPLQQPNMYGAFIASLLPVMFAFMLFFGGRLRMALLVVMLLAVKVMIGTFSRGAYLSFGAAILTQLYFKGKIFFVTSLLIGGMALFFFPEIIPESVTTRLFGHTFQGGDVSLTDTDNIDRSAANRLILWEAAGAMIKESPIFGKGLLSFPNIVTHYLSDESVPERDTHNMFMKIMVYMGIPALLAYLYFFWRTCQNAYHILKNAVDPLRKSIALGAIGMCVSLLVSSMFGSRLENTEMLCYFMTCSAIISFLSQHPELSE
ncbi:O-antigen ligase family protein [Geobacter argillaceus]|uniref:O-antigen ligase-like membrane protein n=1 Tax=Geobacter argillaceus TaxID=345631 RepID=A0A562VHI4_9BACT|nr:O-antigen ligase family protein [Geobacter argillaceus]TWJ17320.1 O-antigen ligase-like membrane protein [Geobacter argillaceus]